MEAKKFSFEGKKLSIKEWALEKGFKEETIRKRLSRGASMEEALKPLTKNKKITIEEIEDILKDQKKGEFKLTGKKERRFYKSKKRTHNVVYYEVECKTCGIKVYKTISHLKQDTACINCIRGGKTIEERIDFFTVKGEAEDCWEWNGSFNKKDKKVWYAMIRHDYKWVRVAKFLLEKKMGRKLEKDCMTCHDCGNHKCVNPGHLREDTAFGNALDRTKHGTLPCGHIIKIDWGKAVRIFDKYRKGGISQFDLALEFDVHPESVSRIINGKGRFKRLFLGDK